MVLIHRPSGYGPDERSSAPPRYRGKPHNLSSWNRTNIANGTGLQSAALPICHTEYFELEYNVIKLYIKRGSMPLSHPCHATH